MDDLDYMDKKTVGMIRNVIRKSFLRYSSAYQEALQEALSMTKGDRGGNRFHCHLCREILALKDLEVDHIIPVALSVPMGKRMTLEGFYKATHCEPSNLQVLCKACHGKKTIADKEQIKKAKKALKIKK